MFLGWNFWLELSFDSRFSSDFYRTFSSGSFKRPQDFPNQPASSSKASFLPRKPHNYIKHFWICRIISIIKSFSSFHFTFAKYAFLYKFFSKIDVNFLKATKLLLNIFKKSYLHYAQIRQLKCFYFSSSPNLI